MVNNDLIMYVDLSYVYHTVHRVIEIHTSSYMLSNLTSTMQN